MDSLHSSIKEIDNKILFLSEKSDTIVKEMKSKRFGGENVGKIPLSEKPN
jgi:hypothetical protein